MVPRRLISWWNQYKYRFVPWIALNLKDRSIRDVARGEIDKVTSDRAVCEELTRYFSLLHDLDKESQTNPPTGFQSKLNAMKNSLGFSIRRMPSQLPGGGTGVFVESGTVEEGAVVAMYPGAIYLPYEPIFFQSIGNPFIFRCIDNILLDGNDKGISKFLYKSCAQRDRVGPYLTCEMDWLTQEPLNPLAIGQYVNNHSKSFSANVAYQEFDVPDDFPFQLRKYIPNIFYSSSIERIVLRPTRSVVLVATRPISSGEEIFSTYFTVVH